MDNATMRQRFEVLDEDKGNMIVLLLGKMELDGEEVTVEMHAFEDEDGCVGEYDYANADIALVRRADSTRDLADDFYTDGVMREHTCAELSQFLRETFERDLTADFLESGMQADDHISLDFKTVRTAT